MASKEQIAEVYEEGMAELEDIPQRLDSLKVFLSPHVWRWAERETDDRLAGQAEAQSER